MKEQLAVVTIGYQKLLLPIGQATKIISVLAGAVKVKYDYDFDARKGCYRIEEDVDVGLEMLGRHERVLGANDQPVDISAPAKRKSPLAIEQKPLALTGPRSRT